MVAAIDTLQSFQERIHPLLLEAYRDWKRGIHQEWILYQQRGNSTLRFVLTVMVVFVVAFHVELWQLWRQMSARGGVLERTKLTLTLSWQQYQRQRRRSRRIKIQQQKLNNDKGPPLSFDPMNANSNSNSNSNFLAKVSSPTSTASTMGVESSLHSSRPMSPFAPPSHANNNNNSRTKALLMTKLPQHATNLSHFSPRPYQDKPAKGVRESYRNRGILDHSLKSQSTCTSPQDSQHTTSTNNHMSFYNSSMRSRSPFRSASIGHGPSKSPTRSTSSRHGQGQQRLAAPYGPGPPPSTRALHSSLRPSHPSTENLSHTSNSSRHSNSNSVTFQEPQRQQLQLHDSSQSFDILATNKDSHFQNFQNSQGSNVLLDSIAPSQQDNTSQLSSNHSCATPEPGQIQQRHTMPSPESASALMTSPPKLQRAQTTDAAPVTTRLHSTTTTKPRPSNKKVTTGSPLAKARRRISASATSTLPSADERLLSRLGATPARKPGRHPRSRSGTGASNASQMYLQRHSSSQQLLRTTTPSSKSAPNTPNNTRSRGRSPIPAVRTPNTKRSSQQQQQQLQRELSRHDLGYE
jgi:hypothetical protein